MPLTLLTEIAENIELQVVRNHLKLCYSSFYWCAKQKMLSCLLDAHFGHIADVSGKGTKNPSSSTDE